MDSEGQLKPLIRSIRPEDHNLVLATWLNSYYEHMRDFRPPRTVYFCHHQELAKLKLKSDVRILCNKEDEDQIIGYSIFDGAVLHYVYVKNFFRGFGFGKMLIADRHIEQVSHLTEDLKKLIKKPVYNPYLFR
jgi:GNAT superfamily N-acetyltransferase